MRESGFLWRQVEMGQPYLIWCLHMICFFLARQLFSKWGVSSMFSTNFVLCFGNNLVNHNTRRQLVNLSGFKEVTNVRNYLGIPLLGRTPKRNDLQYLLDKVKNKQAGWKTKNLSLASRITLAKSVIQSLSVYLMMTIPKSILDEIQKIQCAFVWGDSLDQRRVHDVA